MNSPCEKGRAAHYDRHSEDPPRCNFNHLFRVNFVFLFDLSLVIYALDCAQLGGDAYSHERSQITVGRGDGNADELAEHDGGGRCELSTETFRIVDYHHSLADSLENTLTEQSKSQAHAESSEKVAPFSVLTIESKDVQEGTH